MLPQRILLFSHHLPPVSFPVEYNATEWKICLVQWKLVETWASIFLSHVLLEMTDQKSTKNHCLCTCMVLTWLKLSTMFLLFPHNFLVFLLYVAKIYFCDLHSCIRNRLYFMEINSNSPKNVKLR